MIVPEPAGQRESGESKPGGFIYVLSSAQIVQAEERQKDHEERSEVPPEIGENSRISEAAHHGSPRCCRVLKSHSQER